MSVGGWIEAAAAGLGLRLLGALPAATASRIAGGIAASVGPWLPVSRVAHGNLRLCLPDLDGKARARVVRGVGRSLGQTVGEFPHLAALHETAHGPGFEIEGREVLDEIFARGGPVIFFSAHMGNWEVFAPAARAYGIAVPAFYRAAANPARRCADQCGASTRRRCRGGKFRQGRCRRQARRRPSGAWRRHGHAGRPETQ